MELPCLLVLCQGRLASLPYLPDPSSQRVGTHWRETRGVSAPHCPPHFPKGLPCVPLGEGSPPHTPWHVPHGLAAPVLTGMDPSLPCLSVTLFWSLCPCLLCSPAVHPLRGNDAARPARHAEPGEEWPDPACCLQW